MSHFCIKGVYHRIGGLEVFFKPTIYFRQVHHRIGGLEEDRQTAENTA